VFAYLDVTLPGEALDWFTTNELDKDDAAFWEFKAWPYQIKDRIINEFRLMYWGASIRKELGKYRLFPKWDMSIPQATRTCPSRRQLDLRQHLHRQVCDEDLFGSGFRAHCHAIGLASGFQKAVRGGWYSTNTRFPQG
jgi:hypothetical protein